MGLTKRVFSSVHSRRHDASIRFAALSAPPPLQSHKTVRVVRTRPNDIRVDVLVLARTHSTSVRAYVFLCLHVFTIARFILLPLLSKVFVSPSPNLLSEDPNPWVLTKRVFSLCIRGVTTLQSASLPPLSAAASSVTQDSASRPHPAKRYTCGRIGARSHTLI